MRHPLILLLALTPFLAGNAYAGAWTQAQGDTLLIISNTYYTSGEMYDNHGHAQPQSPYRQYALNPYLEYGWRDDPPLCTKPERGQ